MRALARNTGLLLALGAIFGGGSTVAADQGRFTIDVGAGTVSPANHNGDIEGLGIPPDASVDIDDVSSWAATISYHQTANISYQLYVAPPLEFDISSTGPLAPVGKIAEADILFPTLLVNYTFNTGTNLKPYVGLGLNYTHISSQKSTPALEATLGGPTKVELENSMGVALQAGLRYDINHRWYVNANYLWIDVDSEATTETGGIKRRVDLGIDPSIFYASFGYRF